MRAQGRRPRIVVAGAGIAGSLIVSGLAARDDCEVVCLERAGADDQDDAGTGLTIGPNAIKCLTTFLPRQADAIVRAGLPWTRWRISLMSGEPLMDLPLAEVADNPGIRIGWAELYALLRRPLRDRITYGAELTGCGQDRDGLFATWTDRNSGVAERIGGIDLLIAGDGRYSPIRQHVLGTPEMPRFLNVCLHRMQFPAGPDCPVGDYAQWVNGPNRLLAFRIPGDLIYCAGSFPIPHGGGTPDAMKQPAFLREAYGPPQAPPCREAAYLLDAIVQNAERIHWARLHEGSITYGDTPGILLAGDAAHPMVPTLGQGASQACEDACIVVDEIAAALAAGEPLALVSRRVERRRAGRVRFAVSLSCAATDATLAGAEPAFRQDLARLYRDVPVPRAAPSGLRG